MTADDLIDLLVTRLVREHGGAKHLWRRRVGVVKLYSLTTHAHCNWAIAPTGSAKQIDAIENLIDDLRLSYPILTGAR